MLSREALKILELGCLVCRYHLGVFSPAEAHHIHSDGRRRISRNSIIGLCPAHHRGAPGVIGRHVYGQTGGRRAFETTYQKETDLYFRALGEVNRPHKSEMVAVSTAGQL